MSTNTAPAAIETPAFSSDKEFDERVIHINRCSKTVKGGRRLSFSALVVVGNHKGQVGIGYGKANEVSDAIRKALTCARRKTVTISLAGRTIPHEFQAKHGASTVLVKPASEGTGLIAGGGMRAVLELAGVRDVLAKSLGANNSLNVTKATLKALQSMQTRTDILDARGLK